MGTNNPNQDSHAPLPRGTSFATPNSWNPSNSFVTSWVNTQSVPAMREQPLPPAQFRAPSQLSPISEAIKEEDDGGDETKKVRRRSTTTVRSIINKRRNSIVASRQEISHRMSAVYSRVFPLRGSSIGAPSFVPMSSQTSLIHLKDDVFKPSMRFIFVGVLTVEPLLRHGLEKTKFESFIKTIIFLCFSLDNTTGFVEAQNKWVDDIKANCLNAPIILLGLKKDTCVGTGMRAPKIHPHLFSSPRTARNNQGSSESDIQIMRSVKYIECSAKTGYNVDRVFQEGATLVLAEREEAAALERIRKETEDFDKQEDIENIEKEPAAKPVREKTSGGLAKFLCFK
ncbi:hypothetical protein F4805DRAFT_473886 [Annulohypoxylon moriforme]|nr:hypothetical protein F4805DRAFT_473886 [Annulohypoxylon moriforme]